MLIVCKVLSAYTVHMKTLLALLIALMLTAPVMAQDDTCDPNVDDDCHVICPRWIDERCPCIEGLPQTCPVVEPDRTAPPARTAIAEPPAVRVVRMPAFTGIHGLIPR